MGLIAVTEYADCTDTLFIILDKYVDECLLHVDSLYPLVLDEKGGVQAMVPFRAKMLMIAVCS